MRVSILAKSLTGEEQGRELISVLSVTYIQHYIPFTTCCDERQSISEQQSLVIDVRCFSHIINHVGGHF